MELTKDIKSLDQAKANLAASVDLLKKLQMLGILLGALG
jgi:Vps53-like, N-terminal